MATGTAVAQWTGRRASYRPWCRLPVVDWFERSPFRVREREPTGALDTIPAFGLFSLHSIRGGRSRGSGPAILNAFWRRVEYRLAAGRRRTRQRLAGADHGTYRPAGLTGRRPKRAGLRPVLPQ